MFKSAEAVENDSTNFVPRIFYLTKMPRSPMVSNFLLIRGIKNSFC